MTVDLQRRRVFQSAVAGGALSLGAFVPTPVSAAVARAAADIEVMTWSGCAVNCGSRCQLRVFSKNGRVIRIETDASGDASASTIDGGCTQIRACQRGRSMRQRIYAPERLKFPMKRVGRRGEGRFLAEGRKLSDADPMSYFVDDEKSVNLFLGYAVAASRLKKQLDEQGVVVDEQHPLIVYIPTGVGGAPGGVAYGLKRVYKNAVHCFFAEPTLCPSVLLGFATNLYENVNVHDFGIDGLTEADGLACASPSGFVTRIDSNLISGDFTIEDAKLYDFMRLLHKTEDVLIEPSSCAAFIGPVHLESTEAGKGYLAKQGLTADVMKNATQICWATGGRLVPDEVWKEYLVKVVK